MAYTSNFVYPNAYNPNATYFNQPMAAQPVQPMMSGGMVCRLVASKEEAATTQVPFDGNPYVFPNLTAGEIYVKQFNVNTGNTDFSVYTRFVPRPTNYATEEDIAALREEIAALSKRGGKKKAEVIEDDE